MLQPRTVLRYLRTVILRRDLLSIANWHSSHHVPITSSQFPNHQDIWHIQQLQKCFWRKKKKRQLLLPALQSSPIAHVLLQNASLLQCPLPWTPHFILDHEVDLKQGQVALQAVESFTKVPKIKDQMLLTWVTSGPTNIHDVQK